MKYHIKNHMTSTVDNRRLMSSIQSSIFPNIWYFDWDLFGTTHWLGVLINIFFDFHQLIVQPFSKWSSKKLKNISFVWNLKSLSYRSLPNTTNLLAPLLHHDGLFPSIGHIEANAVVLHNSHNLKVRDFQYSIDYRCYRQKFLKMQSSLF